MSGSGIEQPAAAAPPLCCEAHRSILIVSGVMVLSALLRSHCTTPGTWALIRVLTGQLPRRVLEPTSKRVLRTCGTPDLIEPGVAHEVATRGLTRLHFEFSKTMAGSGGFDAASISPTLRDQVMPRSALASGADRGRSTVLVWTGMVLGVSVLATLARFLAPSLPLSIALDAGWDTVQIVGCIELTLAVVLGQHAAALGLTRPESLDLSQGPQWTLS